MKLAMLLDNLSHGHVHGPSETLIAGLSVDSRCVGHDHVFVAIRGLGVDGHDYIENALNAGATVIVAENAAPLTKPAKVTWVRVPDTEQAIGELAAAYYGHPSRAMPVLAVTGTNGKTSVSWLLAGLLRGAGYQPGLLGTVAMRIGAVERDTIWTTPPAIYLQEHLAEMRDSACSHAVLEVSSHGLAMQRVVGLDVSVGGFTNLSRDHLDFHGTMTEYREAKRLLFTRYAQRACFNLDDPTGREFATEFSGAKIGVSARGADDADFRCIALQSSLVGTEIDLATPQGRYQIKLPLIGLHNVENALVALGMAQLSGLPLEQGVALLEQAEVAPGRLERVPGHRHVFVDYAHSPDALAHALGALRAVTEGRLICVFGAGGDRDAGKRPVMGSVVSAGADVVIVTSDNPRSEGPEDIIDQIVAGIPPEQDYERAADRRVAIHRAIDMAAPADVVLIAGKGHETYQIIGDEQLDFDDREVAREAMGAEAAGRAR